MPKDESVRARDRLIDEYEVQPALRAVDEVLAAAAAVLAASALALALLSPLLSPAPSDLMGIAGPLSSQTSQRPSFCESRYGAIAGAAGAEANGFCK